MGCIVTQLQDDIQVSFELNRAPAEASVAPQTLLIDMLRDTFGLTGSKRSCDMQVCGACTTLVDGSPVSACTVPAFEVRGCSVLTIEGLVTEERSLALTEAFVDNAAFQCGYCTPGMLLAAKALLDVSSRPSEEQIKDYMRGNLCRCTGYKKIVESIVSVGKGGAQAP